MGTQPHLDLGREPLHQMQASDLRDRRCRHPVLGYLLSSEQTSTQAQLLFAHALEDQQGAEGGGAAPGRLPVIGSWFAARAVYALRDALAKRGLLGASLAGFLSA